MVDTQYISEYFDLSQINSLWVEYWYKTNVLENSSYFNDLNHILHHVYHARNYDYAPPEF